MKFISAIILSMLFISGCYYDKADLVYPSASSCDTTNITYSATVVTILSNNCYICHSGNASSGGGIVMDSYSNLKPYITNGQLMNAINQNGAVPAMPLGTGKISSCEISHIAAWINKGALNN